jgi:hypothetical protein
VADTGPGVSVVCVGDVSMKRKLFDGFTGEEKFAMRSVGALCIILAIGAIGSKLYVDSPKIPAGDREAASHQAIYTNNDFQPSLDAILKARGETK